MDYLQLALIAVGGIVVLKYGPDVIKLIDARMADLMNAVTAPSNVVIPEAKQPATQGTNLENMSNEELNQLLQQLQGQQGGQQQIDPNTGQPIPQQPGQMGMPGQPGMQGQIPGLQGGMMNPSQQMGYQQPGMFGQPGQLPYGQQPGPFNFGLNQPPPGYGQYGMGDFSDPFGGYGGNMYLGQQPFGAFQGTAEDEVYFSGM